jgi:hypothetical protein
VGDPLDVPVVRPVVRLVEPVADPVVDPVVEVRVEVPVRPTVPVVAVVTAVVVVGRSPRNGFRAFRPAVGDGVLIGLRGAAVGDGRLARGEVCGPTAAGGPVESRLRSR